MNKCTLFPKKKVEVVLFVILLIIYLLIYTINGACPDNLEMQNKWQSTRLVYPL